MSPSRSPDLDRRVRNSTLVLLGVALVLYFGYIAMTVLRHGH